MKPSAVFLSASLPLALFATAALGSTFSQVGDQDGQSAAIVVKRQTWEYKIETEPKIEQANELGADGWEFAGYYSQSDKGSAVSLTLWKRPK